MKKVFKKIGIVVIVIVALVIAYQIFIVISDKIDDYNVKKEQEKLQEERINAKTLMEYVKTHDYKYIQCNEDEENCDSKYYMEFTTQDFKCDALDNIQAFDYNYFITKDNEIYDISFDGLYSNNQNCKKKDTIKKIVRDNVYGNMILSKDNKLYRGNFEEVMYSSYSSFEFKKVLINDDSIKYILETDQNNNYDDNMSREITSLVLKKDNKIYKQYYKEKEIYNENIGDYDYKITFKKEEIYKSLEEYGNIQEIVTSNYYTSNSGKEYQLEENTIKTIISDKGYYYLDEVKTDECSKYKDIECKLELKESEIYKRFSKDIKFIGKQYTILSDNSIIYTSYLTYPLDKDLKN